MIHYIFHSALDHTFYKVCKENGWKTEDVNEPHSGLCGSEAPIFTVKVTCPLTIRQLTDYMKKNNCELHNMDYYDEWVNL